MKCKTCKYYLYNTNDEFIDAEGYEVLNPLHSCTIDGYDEYKDCEKVEDCSFYNKKNIFDKIYEKTHTKIS